MINVVCAIILFNDKILVTQRGINMSHPLKWEFPGGKLEINESEQDCINREIREELNIEIELVKKLTNNIHNYGSYIVNLIPYIAKYKCGYIFLTEHNDYKILNKSVLSELDWAEADIPILNEFLKTKL